MTSKIALLENLPVGKSLEKAKNLGADGIIKEVKASGLLGRGGAGFPTGLKWEFTSKSPGEKYIVCNADEGEVGTFKDRELLVNCPEKILEGIAIAALAVAAKKALIYLRWEYSYLKEELQNKINAFKKICPELGIELRSGAGAYVCGEETAMLDSLEGKRGEPRNKPPFPTSEGYLCSPTVINNVETLCCVPHIILQGAAEFAAIGTEKSKGPKLFSVSGDIEKPGVYQFPLGITLGEILKAAGAKEVKGTLVGGASGFCCVVSDFNRKLAFEDLAPGGSIVVFNKSRKMGEVLLNLMEFFLEESCCQCTPCREGNYQLVKFIKKILKEGTTTCNEMRRHIELANIMKDSSKCGLGQSSPNPFLSILNKFGREFVKIKG